MQVKRMRRGVLKADRKKGLKEREREKRERGRSGKKKRLVHGGKVRPKKKDRARGMTCCLQC